MECQGRSKQDEKRETFASSEERKEEVTRMKMYAYKCVSNARGSSAAGAGNEERDGESKEWTNVEGHWRPVQEKRERENGQGTNNGKKDVRGHSIFSGRNEKKGLIHPKKSKQWTEENMKRAIMAVRNKKMDRGSKYLEFQNRDLNKLVSTKLGRKPILDSELEQSLFKYCLDVEARFYGLTKKDVKKMAFHLAEKILFDILSTKGILQQDGSSSTLS
ncbi:hypothetical protein J437_LFUL007204 [Ladona fulva]|uniref:Uncharacterized protein n=1 Tax=Ladona fulva TaxID=123851 RepID=A0A8K0NXE2_LADFU|nr:hypothetical protein J437_LFUL007204 [Ladona fulva]